MDFEQEILALKARNQKVEADKAWEVSSTRKMYIAAITYVVAVAWLLVIHEPGAWLKAVVPVVGYVLSTITIPPIKRKWEQKKTV